MPEPWKVIICDSKKCQSEAFDIEGKVKENYYIYPDVDTEYMTQFTCPRCGKIETWGLTRKSIAKILYERVNGIINEDEESLNE